MNRFLFVVLVLMFSLPALAADGFSSLEEQMTGAEYEASGLDKLTPEELAALNNWIRNHSVATLDLPRSVSTTPTIDEGKDQRGFEKEAMAEMGDQAIVSQIKGNFSGWDGSTVFVLENGMIWEQADKDKFHVRDVENIGVTIKRGMFNTWRLQVDGYNSECRVERVQ
jgi:uncharacterized protein YdeI (BOF family)